MSTRKNKGDKVTSPKKVEANRRNAAKSPGPTSDRGKSKSKFNALKFGLFSEMALLAGEDPAEYRQMKEAIFAELRPNGFFQNLLADEIVDPAWRLQRVRQAEPAFFERINNSLKILDVDANRSRETFMKIVAMFDEVVRIRHEEARAAGLISDSVNGQVKKPISEEKTSPKQPKTDPPASEKERSVPPNLNDTGRLALEVIAPSGRDVRPVDFVQMHSYLLNELFKRLKKLRKEQERAATIERDAIDETSKMTKDEEEDIESKPTPNPGKGGAIAAPETISETEPAPPSREPTTIAKPTATDKKVTINIEEDEKARKMWGG